ncbi:MAG: hypothetical protein PVI30_23320 [Myxococcales bacterium]|jgi:predicted metal-dependent hydrolase
MAAVQTTFDFAAFAPRSPLDPEVAEQRSRSRLERRLAELMGRPVALTLTDNSRTMISSRARAGADYVRLHHMFVEADEPTVRALALFLTRGDRFASGHLERFVDENRDRIRKRPPRSASLDPRGDHHDLHALREGLEGEYFDVAQPVRVGWGRMGRPPGRRRRRSSIKLGSYRARDASIRVHPVLDAAWVPAYFVEFVLYHEMLHHVLGIHTRGGRRQMHTPEFRHRERMFARYDEAIAWERDNLDRLLRA